MTTEIWCEIVCAKCAKASFGVFTTGKLPRNALKAQAKKYGWVFSKNQAFCNSFCKDDYDKAAQEDKS